MALDLIRCCVDRRLSDDLLLRAADRSVAERAANEPAGADRARTRRQRVRLAVATGRMWSNGRTLRVAFLGGSPAARESVAAIAAQWTRHANLVFSYDADPREAELRIGFEPGPAWSLVGTEALAAGPAEPTMNLGGPPDDFEAMVLHEFGHAIGCVHEHSSPRGGIPWDLPAVYRYYGGPPNQMTKEEVDRNVIAKYDHDQARASAYDPESIMLYPIPAELTAGRHVVGVNRALSALDRSYIAECYPVADPAATLLPSDGSPVPGRIAVPDGVERFRFTVSRPGDYRLETSGYLDLRLRVYGPGGAPAPLADTAGGGLGGNVRVELPLMEGDYRVEVRHQRPTGTGRYTLALHEPAAR